MSTKKTMLNHGICIIHKNNNNIEGYVKFINKEHKTKIEYEIKGLSDGEHGFHIHKYGDLSDGCKSACAHFNPTNSVHGSRTSKQRHIGDLGNIVSKNGLSKGYFYDKFISLDYKHKNCIIGRSIIIHADRDDLGKGGDEESLKTGNAGKRLACGVIGLTNKC